MSLSTAVQGEAVGALVSGSFGLLAALIVAATVRIRRWIKNSDTSAATQELIDKVTAVSVRQERHSTDFRSFREESLAHRQKVESDVGAVRKELTTNGGGTLKDAIQALQVNFEAVNAKLRLMAGANNWVMWESGADGRCKWASPAMCRVLQRPFDEIEGDAWRALIHEPDRARVFAEWDAAVAQRRPFRMSYHWVRRDGVLLAVFAEAHPLRTASGVVAGYIAQVTLIGDPLQPPPDAGA